MTAGSAGACAAAGGGAAPSGVGAVADGVTAAGAEGTGAAEGAATGGAVAGGVALWAGVSAAGGVCACDVSLVAAHAKQTTANNSRLAEPYGRSPTSESRSLIALCRPQKNVRHLADITKTVRILSSLHWSAVEYRDDMWPTLLGQARQRIADIAKLQCFWNVSNQESLRAITWTSQSMKMRTRGESCRLRG
jgi:hypothetical protein